MSTLNADVLARLRQFDTPTICNVIELFDVVPRNVGYCDGRIQACYPKLPPMVGFAVTATFRAATPAPAGAGYGGLAEQVATLMEQSGPSIMVIQDLDDPTVAATFGEIMCTTYKRFGAVGLITSGAGRDLDQVEALQFPCFTNGTICAHGYCHFPQLNVQVRIGGVTMQPGTLLHGDRNGVTTIPLKIASAIADACPEYVAAEGVILDYLKREKVDARGYAEARRGCQEQLESLSRRLRRS